MQQRFFSLILVLSPILSAYGLSPQAEFGIFSVLVFGILTILFNKGRFTPKFPKGYLLFFVVALFFAVVFTKSLPLRLLLFSVNIAIACRFADYEYVVKYYSKAVVFCCVYFLFQEIVFIVTGVRASGLIPFFPIIYGDTIAYTEHLVEAGRSASVFLEPSYLVQYLFPYLAIKLFSSNPDDFKKAVYVSLIILLVRSGNGVLLLAVTWGIWFFYSNIRRSKKIIIAVAATAVVGLVLISVPEFYDSIFGRMAELQSYDANERFFSSGFIRIFRGYYLYSEMSSFQQLFGASDMVINDMMDKSILFAQGGKVINGVQTLLVHNGLIVCVLYLAHIIQFATSDKSKTMIVLTIGFMLLMLTETYYLCSRSLFHTALMFALANHNRLKAMETRLKPRSL